MPGSQQSGGEGGRGFKLFCSVILAQEYHWCWIIPWSFLVLDFSSFYEEDNHYYSFKNAKTKALKLYSKPPSPQGAHAILNQWRLCMFNGWDWPYHKMPLNPSLTLSLFPCLSWKAPPEALLHIWECLFAYVQTGSHRHHTLCFNGLFELRQGFWWPREKGLVVEGS